MTNEKFILNLEISSCHRVYSCPSRKFFPSMLQDHDYTFPCYSWKMHMFFQFSCMCRFITTTSIDKSPLNISKFDERMKPSTLPITVVYILINCIVHIYIYIYIGKCSNTNSLVYKRTNNH